MEKTFEVDGKEWKTTVYKLKYSEFDCRTTTNEAKKLKLNLLFLALLKDRFTTEELATKTTESDGSPSFWTK